MPQKITVAVLATGLLAACSASHTPTADLGKISSVKASFGPQYKVTEVPPTGIDPKFLSGQRLPEGLRFEPEGCAKFATGQLVPEGTEGNMSALSAEGDGSRFVVIAVETNEAVPVVEPGSDCQKVSFAGGTMRGTVEAVEVPKIDGTKTIGVHRVLQTVVDGKPRAGEVYNYSAHFGNFQVIVAANPLVVPGKPTVPVNTQKARDLLIAGVNAIRN
jgi:hypothetical protein